MTNVFFVIGMLIAACTIIGWCCCRVGAMRESEYRQTRQTRQERGRASMRGPALLRFRFGSIPTP